MRAMLFHGYHETLLAQNVAFEIGKFCRILEYTSRYLTLGQFLEEPSSLLVNQP
jgi:hypothetical protein